MRQFAILSAGVCAFALAQPAMAQSAARQAAGGGRAAPAQAGAEGAGPADQDVVVTASRTIRDGRDSPTPLTVANADQLEMTPTSIPDALNKLPQFAGSTSSVGSGNGAGSGRSNIFSGNYINLRSFGAIRTLVLQDGHRVPPTTLNGQVDANTIPQLLVKRVDIVTGGASAVYGSDAVTGVVNFIIDKGFKGLKGQIQRGISGAGDGATFRAGLAGGIDVTDRGHLVVSVEHSENDGIRSTADRAWSATGPVYTGLGTAASPFLLTLNGRINNVSDGGLITAGPNSVKGLQFAGGGLAAFNAGVATLPISQNISVGGDGSSYHDVTLVVPVTTDQGFARFDYRLSDDITFYAQATVARATSNGFRNLNERPNSYRIFSGNAFLPASVQGPMTSTNTAFITLGRLNNDLMADAYTNQKTTSQRYTAGLTGKAFGEFKWDLYYTYGQADVSATVYNNINYPNFYAALDAVQNTQGQTVCRVTVTNPGLYPNCVPINMFGTGNQSQAAKNFIYQNTGWAATNRMHDAGGSITGSPFSTWAGPVSISVNAEYRKESLVETTNASSLLVPDFTGIRMGAANTIPTTVWAYPTEAGMYGQRSVWEAGGEILIPLLQNVPFAQRLAVNAAARYTHYSTSGDVDTWKIGAIWQPVTDLRFRGSISRDIRAPTLNDLFAGPSATFATLTDPHTGVTGTVGVVKSGNPSLVPEIARTYTVGFQYTPSWLPRFALSVDYFKINIANAISAINGADPTVLLDCETSGGTSPVCAAITRPLPFSNTSAANFPTAILNSSLNAAETYTSGVDVEASYHLNLSRLGALDFRLLYTYQPVLKSRSFPTSTQLDYAGAPGLSKSRVTGFINYKDGGFSLGTQMRYYSPQKRSENPTLVFVDPPLGSQFYVDLNIEQEVKAGGVRAAFFFNVNNLFDRQPRISPSTTRPNPGTGNPAVAGDDVLGRYFTAGVRFNF
ncbi:MAG: putative Outer rane cobalamin receptor protein [Sphingomonas bacterium]|nr:putative Outer rane cobalamin receptor protein [Sphingomonas bacterium]